MRELYSWDAEGLLLPSYVLLLQFTETQGAKLLLRRQVLSARLQPGKDPAIVIGEIAQLLAALDEVGILVHEGSSKIFLSS